MSRKHRVQLRRSARLQHKTMNYTECNTDEDLSSDNDDTSNHSSSNEHSHRQPQQCICNEPQDDRIMICCDQCNIWHHYDCAHLSLRKANQLSLSKHKWFCINCKPNTNKRKRPSVNPSSLIDSPPNKRRKENNNTLCTTADPQQTIVNTFFDQCLHTLISSHNPLLFPFDAQSPPITITEHKEDIDTEEICTQNTDTITSNIIDNEVIMNDIQDSDSDLEILNAPNMIVIPVIMNTESMKEDDSDNEIEIQAGDKWIESQSFLENKERYKQDIMDKKKQEMNKCLDDDDDEREFVVLNQNKTSKQDLCPLTLKKIERPIKNVCCPHIYEREAILNYIQYLDKNDKDNKCPVPGCDTVLWIIC